MTKAGLSAYERIQRKTLVLDGPDACHIFQGATVSGYGAIRINKQTIAVHRFIYEYFKGPIPFYRLVMHRCNNRRCCNPDHLSVGTYSDNLKHAYDTGAHKPRGPAKQQPLEDFNPKETTQ